MQRLRGMFAFAIWDARRRRLSSRATGSARSRSSTASGTAALTFASELGALLQDPDIPRDLDHDAIDAYLAYRYVPARRSAPSRACASCRRPRRCVLAAGRAADRALLARSTTRRSSGVTTCARPREALRERSRAATRSGWSSDVPLGAFLSGGVDSTAVVAAMAETSPEPVRTFSIGFERRRLRRAAARARASRSASRTEHHELVVGARRARLVSRIAAHFGEPFADPSALPSF